MCIIKYASFLISLKKEGTLTFKPRLTFLKN